MEHLFQMDEQSTQPSWWSSHLLCKSVGLQMDQLQKVLSAHPKMVVQSGITETSSKVEKIAQSNSKVDSQLPGISTTQQYLK